MTVVNAISSHESPTAASTDDVSRPSSNIAASLNYAAAAGVSHCLGQVAWSYSGTPTGGNLKIEDGSGNTVFSMDITAAGPGCMAFKPPKKGTAGRALLITLAAGGSSKSGKLSATHWTE
jgi:hypothetical protein